MTNMEKTQTLIERVRKGDAKLSEIRDLVKQGADVNAKTESGIPLLVLSCMRDNLAVSNYLLERGANPNETTLNKRNALHTLAEVHFKSHRTENNDVQQFVDKLIRVGCDIDAQDEHGNTPLMIAVGLQSPHFVAEKLLEHRAKVSIKNDDGATAVDYAGDYAPGTPIIETLKKAQADEMRSNFQIANIGRVSNRNQDNNYGQQSDYRF